MTESSRSAQPILDLANRLITMVERQHPDEGVRLNAFRAHLIEPAFEGSNPVSRRGAVKWLSIEGNKADEVQAIAKGVKQAQGYMPAGRALSQAVLVQTNDQVEQYRQALLAEGVPVIAVGAESEEAAICAQVVLQLLRFLALDADAVGYRHALVDAFVVYWRGINRWDRYDKELKTLRDALIRFVDECKLDWRKLLNSDGAPYPIPGYRWAGESAPWEAWLEFLGHAGVLLHQRHLSPVDLVTAVAERYFRDPYQLSVAEAIAMMVRRILYQHPDFRLGDVVQELAMGDLSRGSHKVFRASREDAPNEAGHDPAKPLPVRVMTLHGAKGLEFDCVWLPGLNQSRHFPWELKQARVSDQRILLVEHILKNLHTLDSPESGNLIDNASAWQVAERLRLLYVGITRAKQVLRLSYLIPTDFTQSKYPHLIAPWHITELARISDG